MSIVELDGGDAKKMLDDLQDAKGLAAEVANGGAPSMDEAHDLVRRLGRSKDLLARTMVAEKMSGEDEPSTFSELQAESLRFTPTDEPVSGEGEEARRQFDLTHQNARSKARQAEMGSYRHGYFTGYADGMCETRAIDATADRLATHADARS